MLVHLAAILLNLVMLLALLGVGLVGWRTDIAETAVDSYLAQRGFPEARLKVVELTPRQLRLADVRLGTDALARTAEVRFALDELSQGRIERVELTGLRLSVDLTQPGPFARYRALIPGNGSTPETDTAERREPLRGGFALPDHLPRVDISDARIRVTGAGPARTVTLSTDATLSPGEDGLRAALRGELATESGRLDFALNAEDLRRNPKLNLEALGRAKLGELPWPERMPSRPTKGELRLSLRFDGPLPTSPEQLDFRMLQHDHAGGKLTLKVTGADLPPYAEGVSVQAETDIEIRPAGALLRLSKPVEIEAAKLDPDSLPEGALPLEARELVRTLQAVRISPWTEAGELLQIDRGDDGWHWDSRATLQATFAQGTARLAMNAGGNIPADLERMKVTADPVQLDLRDLPYGERTLSALTFNGRAEGGLDSARARGNLRVVFDRLRLDAQTLEGVSFEGPVTLTREAETLTAALVEPGRLTVESYPLTGPVQVPPPLNATLRRGEARLGPGGLDGRLIIDPGKLQGTVLRDGEPDVTIEAEPGPVDLSVTQGDADPKVTAKLRGAAVTLPELKIRARDMDADLAYGAPDEPLLQLSVGLLETMIDPPPVAPLSADVTAERQDDGTIAADGTLELRNDTLKIPFQARHDPAAQSGELTFGPATAAFKAAGLSPRQVAPMLASGTEVTGQTSIEGRLRWGPGGFESRCALNFDNLTVDTGSLRIEALTGAVNFDRVLPPKTAPGQELRASQIVAGVPLTDFLLRFGFQSSTLMEPMIEIDRAEGRLAGGVVAVETTTLRPLADRNSFTLQVDGLSLSQLFEQLDLEGVSGEGTLSGSIPVLVRDGKVTVDQGKLAAESDGVLRIRLGGTGEALASQGEQVALMLRALEDFRYDVLELTLRRPVEGDLELGVTMEGRNPDVLDGYPFRFNISLTGDLEPVLTALQEGRALTSELLQRALEAEEN